MTDKERCAINRNSAYRLSLLGCVLIALLLIGCGKAPTQIAPTHVLPTGIPAPTPLPPLPTSAPLGSDVNPIKVMFVVPDKAAVKDAATDLADALSNESNLTIKVNLTESAPEARLALCNRDVALVTLDAFNYLAASQENCGAPVYVVQKAGATQTQGQYIGWTEFRAETFRGVFCRPDANSINGWIIPTLTMRAHFVNMFTDMYNIVDAGSDEGVVRAIDTRKCDMGAITIGALDNITDLINPASIVPLEDLTPVPNDVVVLSASFDAALQTQLGSLVTNHAAEIATLMGGEALQPASDGNFSDLRDLFSDAGVDPAAMGE
jgi:hypothetical protein